MPHHQSDAAAGVGVERMRDLNDANVAGRDIIQNYYLHPTPEQQADLQRGLERLRQQDLQQSRLRQETRRKWVGRQPAEEIACFVNREAYLDRVTEAALDPDRRLIVIVGQGGIGKTALAAKFCDGIRQAGFRLADRPVRAVVFVSRAEMAAFSMDQVFDKLAQTLDPEAAARVKPVLEDRGADIALKTETLLNALQDGATLLVLDNFETLLDAAAIRDPDLEMFLTTVCHNRHGLTVLITSRNQVRLDAVAGVDAPVVIDKGLDDAHAVEYLRRLRIGGRPVAPLARAADADLHALARKVYGIPAALKSLACFLKHRKRLSIADLLAEDELYADFRQHDFTSGLTKLVAQQYALLPEPARRALQALAVFDAPAPVEAAQSLFPDLDADTLDALADDYALAQENPQTGCYELHPVIRDYAYAQIPALDERDLRADLHQRAADYYAELKHPEEAWNSIDDLRPHLREIEQRIRAGRHDRAARILNQIDFDYLQLWGHSRIVIRLRQQLRGRLTDEYLMMVNAGNLGMTYKNIGRVREAIPLYEEALASARKEKNRQGEGAWLGNLGLAYADLGEPRRAIEYYEQALAIARDIGDRRGEGADLGSLGLAYADLGEPRRAIAYYEQALAIDREIGDRRSEGSALGNLGNAYANLGEPRRAIECHEQALAIAREIGDRRGEGIRLGNLGNAYANLGEPRRAIEQYEQALAIDREVGYRQGEGIRLGNLGEAYCDLYLDSGDAALLAQARACHQQALDIFEAIEAPDGVCFVILALGYDALPDAPPAQAGHQMPGLTDQAGSSLLTPETGRLSALALSDRPSDGWTTLTPETGRLSALALSDRPSDGRTTLTPETGRLSALDLSDRPSDGRAAGYFQRCVAACDHTLEQADAPLYGVLYNRAHALLGLALLHPPPGPDATDRAYDEAVAAYGNAVAACAEPGVLQQARRDVERLRRLAQRRGLPPPPMPAALVNEQ